MEFNVFFSGITSRKTSTTPRKSPRLNDHDKDIDLPAVVKSRRVLDLQ